MKIWATPSCCTMSSYRTDANPLPPNRGNAPPEFFPVLISLKPNKIQRSVEVDLRGITGRRELGGEQDEFLVEQIQFEDLAEESGPTTDMATLVGTFCPSRHKRQAT